jgi:D-aminoacyl-tRNA deacylase
MKTAIICPKPDEASMTIRKALLDLYPFKETKQNYEGNPVFQLTPDIHLYTTETESVFCEDIDKKINADLFIFATKHQAKSGIPSLSVHTQGNWAKAEYGGKDRTLAISPACYLKEALIKLEEYGTIMKQNGFDIIQECTHHGPYLDKPSMFIEIGSDLTQWQNREPAEVIAKVIHHLVTHQPPKCRTAVGIGGPHHTPNFKKIILGTDIALGHVCPKYLLEHLDKELIIHAIERTEPKAELVIIDWKGLDSKEKIAEMLNGIDIKIMKTKEF